MMTKRVVVFIPAYNEEETIARMLGAIAERYRDADKKGYTVETLVVDDGSTDATLARAQQAGANRIVSHPYNLGLGAATRTGMEEAYRMGADVAVKMDADFQHLPEDIEKVVMPILENKCDICWGSRFSGKITYRMPLIRKIGNRFFTWLMNRLTPYRISDAQTGLFAFNRKYLAIFEIMGDYNPPQQLLIDASQKKLRYAEVPVTFEPRRTGQSFVSLIYPFRVGSYILRIFIYSNPFKIFGTSGVALIMLAAGIYLAGLGVKYLRPEWLVLFPVNISISLLTIGLQVFFFGLIADMILKRTRK